MSKTSQKSQEERSDVSDQPITDGRQSTAEPIYQIPSAANSRSPVEASSTGQQPTTNSQKPTAVVLPANSRLFSSQQPTANNYQPTANSQ